VRLTQPDRIRQHARERFRSEYHYAVFEYYRSAKVIAFLEQHGVTIGGRILDAGCGGGGMPVSLAEEQAHVTAIDLKDRFVQAGERLRDELGIRHLRFAQADGLCLPFAARAFEGVLSHAVIEHVADADRYLLECARVLKPGGWMYLSTSPYLSFAGAHLPRLVVPIPLHLLLGRRASFAKRRTRTRSSRTRCRAGASTTICWSSCESAVCAIRSRGRDYAWSTKN
jgi:2-polyprenyl-3-methyl-5-hydroxy-6-metoxy-1,4-benzoquinol methylase